MPQFCACAAAAQVALLGALLVARTAFSVYITEIIGFNAQAGACRGRRRRALRARGAARAPVDDDGDDDGDDDDGTVVSRDWSNLSIGMVRFALITLPAAVINSGLKYSSSLLSLMWRTRLSEHVHKVRSQPWLARAAAAAGRDGRVRRTRSI